MSEEQAVYRMAKEIPPEAFDILEQVKQLNRIPSYLCVNIVDSQNLRKNDKGAQIVVLTTAGEISELDEDYKASVVDDLIKNGAIEKDAPANDVLAAIFASFVEDINVMSASADSFDEEYLTALATIIRAFKPEVVFSFLLIELFRVNVKSLGQGIAVSITAAVGPRPEYLELIDA